MCSVAPAQARLSPAVCCFRRGHRPRAAHARRHPAPPFSPSATTHRSAHSLGRLPGRHGASRAADVVAPCLQSLAALRAVPQLAPVPALPARAAHVGGGPMVHLQAPGGGRGRRRGRAPRAAGAAWLRWSRRLRARTRGPPGLRGDPRPRQNPNQPSSRTTAPQSCGCSPAMGKGTCRTPVARSRPLYHCRRRCRWPRRAGRAGVSGLYPVCGACGGGGRGPVGGGGRAGFEGSRLARPAPPTRWNGGLLAALGPGRRGKRSRGEGGACAARLVAQATKGCLTGPHARARAPRPPPP